MTESDSAAIVHLQPTRPQEEIAQEVRVRMERHLADLIETLNFAAANGLNVNYATAAAPNRRHYVANLQIFKLF